MGLLIFYSGNKILKCLDKVYLKIKKSIQKSEKEKHKKGRQYFLRSDSSSPASSPPSSPPTSSKSLSSTLENDLSQKIFILMEQWFKYLFFFFLESPHDKQNEFFEKLLKFASTHVRKDHLLILKAFYQQIKNQTFSSSTLLSDSSAMLALVENDSDICS